MASSADVPPIAIGDTAMVDEFDSLQDCPNSPNPSKSSTKRMHRECPLPSPSERMQDQLAEVTINQLSAFREQMVGQLHHVRSQEQMAVIGTLREMQQTSNHYHVMSDARLKEILLAMGEFDRRQQLREGRQSEQHQVIQAQHQRMHQLSVSLSEQAEFAQKRKDALHPIKEEMFDERVTQPVMADYPLGVDSFTAGNYDHERPPANASVNPHIRERSQRPIPISAPNLDWSTQRDRNHVHGNTPMTFGMDPVPEERRMSSGISMNLHKIDPPPKFDPKNPTKMANPKTRT